MIIAIDFDGILTDTSAEFPEIGKPNYEVVLFTRQLLDAGHEVVLWTSRTGTALAKAVEWCVDHGLTFTAVNENAPSNVAKYEAMFPNGTRKVYADVYLDDHSAEFLRASNKRGYKWAIKNALNSAWEVIEHEKR